MSAAIPGIDAHERLMEKTVAIALHDIAKKTLALDFRYSSPREALAGAGAGSVGGIPSLMEVLDRRWHQAMLPETLCFVVTSGRKTKSARNCNYWASKII